jgi:hypothetical protein
VNQIKQEQDDDYQSNQGCGDGMGKTKCCNWHI